MMHSKTCDGLREKREAGGREKQRWEASEIFLRGGDLVKDKKKYVGEAPWRKETQVLFLWADSSMFMPSYCVFWTSWDSILVFECVYWGPSFVFMEFWAHLHPHYTRVPTYFPNSVLRFCMWHWHSCLVFLFETPFEIRFGPPPIFELIGWYKKWGAYGFILLLLLVLCFCCVSWKFRSQHRHRKALSPSVLNSPPT